MPKVTLQLNADVYERRKRIFAVEFSKLFLAAAAANASVFGKDMDLAIIAHTVGLIALGNALGRSDGTADYRDLNVLLGDRQRGATPFSIAEATGIPRTTVLRKLGTLVKMGILQATQTGGFVYVPGKIQSKPFQRQLDAQAKVIVKLANELLAADILRARPEGDE